MSAERMRGSIWFFPAGVNPPATTGSSKNRRWGLSSISARLPRWVMREFERDGVLYTLFRAQDEFVSKARKAGFRKHRISFLAFAELENQQIPNF